MKRSSLLLLLPLMSACAFSQNLGDDPGTANGSSDGGTSASISTSTASSTSVRRHGDTPGDSSHHDAGVINISIAHRPIASGLIHTCMVKDGVKCWGSNSAGQLGNGSGSSSSVPVSVSGITDAIAVASGIDHSCALSSTGSVQCWGDNDSGQLGNNSKTSSPTPVNVSVLTSSVDGIAAGGNETCAILRNGTVECWGQFNAADNIPAPSQTPITVVDGGGTPITGVVDVTVGANFTCLLTSVGGVKCFGAGIGGQLGYGGSTSSATAVDVTGLASGVVAINAGSDADTACAVMSTGGVKCWGWNYKGAAGITADSSSCFEEPNVLTPTDLPLANIRAIGGGGLQGCAIGTQGDLSCWGEISQELDRCAPTSIAGANAVVVTGGEDFNCFTTSAGGAQCFGSNGAPGVLGNGTTAASATPVDVLF